jgi:sterol desaturase/sphingolipid hydroxylase (fatty acid hydroxylase superfamily)/creatinine amidohydrolase/Fe(II)-dependent formamide hydrolase-like protein
MDYLLARLLDPLHAPLDPQHRVFWLYLLGALALALVLFLAGRGDGRKRSPRGFLSFCLPASVYLHKSAKVDYAYFVVNRIVFGLLLLPVIGAVSLFTAAATKALLVGALATPPLLLSDSFGWTLAHTALAALAIDFGLFLAHVLQHRVPTLWEFHKVHHSAQVLTPLTAYRMHPVDDLLSMSLAGALSGLVFGVFEFLRPGNAGIWTVLGLNAALFLYYATGYNLRHSHLWLSYGPWFSRVLVSPAQHQIHHSKAPEHFDRNFGFIFAFWDAWFGSLYVPRAREPIEVGLPGGEDAEYSNLLRLYLLPFRKCGGDGVRRASVALLGFVLVALSVQSVSIVQAALTERPPEPPQARLALPNAKSLPAMPSVFLEDLTWTEVRELVNAGVRIAIVPTGGTEQNGPHMILGKHNYIIRHTAGEIARRLRAAVVAPVVAYVPEGSIEPPSGHMGYAGTISVPDPVFEAVLEHTARSLKAHGFEWILFVGDSRENQPGQARVAEKLNREWRVSGARVLHVGDYYAAHGQLQWLQQQGETDASIGFHAGIRDTSELLFVHPAGIRTDRVALSTSWRETGADGDPTRASAERGQALIELKISAALRQITAELERADAPVAAKRSESRVDALSL